MTEHPYDQDLGDARWPDGEPVFDYGGKTRVEESMDSTDVVAFAMLCGLLLLAAVAVGAAIVAGVL